MGTKYSDDLALITSAPFNNPPPSRRKDGRERVAIDAFEVAVGDLDSADIIALTRLPSTANIISLRVGWDDLGTTATFDLGLYTAAGAAGDTDIFATAQAGGTAQALTEYRYSLLNLDTAGKAIWELLGLSVDNGKEYDIALTLTASSAPAAGTIAYDIRYVID